MNKVVLQRRFFHSTESLLSVMALTGVFLVPSDSHRLWKRVLIKSFSIFWLIFCLHSNAVMAIKRTCLLNTGTGTFASCVNADGRLIGQLTNMMIRLSQLISDTTIHLTLICTVEGTIVSFLNMLDQVDKDLKRPSLLSIRKTSLIGLIYLTTTVGEINLWIKTKSSLMRCIFLIL